MPAISIDKHIEALTARGAKIIEHATMASAAQSTVTGSDPLDKPIDDGFYRIVQLDEDSKAADASFGIKNLKEDQKEFPVVMNTTPEFVTQFWKFTRQYGPKDGYTIVPVLTPGSSDSGLGGTAVNKDNAVNVKRSSCYPIWTVKCSESVHYKDGEKPVDLYYYRIYEVGSKRCWKTNKQEAVTIADAASSGRPPASELYQLVKAETEQVVTVSSVETISVSASSADVVKRYYFGSQMPKEQLERILSMQLVTDAHDQGWATSPERGLWSWFEIAVFSKAPAKGGLVSSGDIKKGSDGKPLTWLSHRVALESSFAEQSGPVFAKDHEIWKNVKAGDYIGVLACAQYKAWSLSARSGSLKFKELLA